MQVALAELGTPDAGGVFERLLSRRLSADAVEQAWYWVDLASALRLLNRAEALPAVLRCTTLRPTSRRVRYSRPKRSRSLISPRG